MNITKAQASLPRRAGQCAANLEARMKGRDLVVPIEPLEAASMLGIMREVERAGAHGVVVELQAQGIQDQEAPSTRTFDDAIDLTPPDHARLRPMWLVIGVALLLAAVAAVAL